MTGKWIARLLESTKSPAMPENETLKTFKTPKNEVSRVLKVADLAASGKKRQPLCIDPAALHSYHAARQRLAADVPDGISTLHWDQALTDADAFLVTWGDTAALSGWTAGDLFDVPDQWIGGLIWYIAGGLVLGLTEQIATIEAEGKKSFFARPMPSTTANQEPIEVPCPPWRQRNQHKKN